MQLNHTIVLCTDKRRSSGFLVDVLGRPPPTSFGPFLVVALDNGVSLDFLDTRHRIQSQHYAFLINEAEFDMVFQRIKAREVAYWADPARARRGELNSNDGGRGMYFGDPDDHLFEVLTVPYGGWPKDASTLATHETRAD